MSWAAGHDVSPTRAKTVPHTPEPTEIVTDRLRRVVAGHAESEAWLYDTFAPRLYRRLKARYDGQPGLDPDDVFQDAFVSFFRNEARALARFLDRVPAAEQTDARLEGYLWGLACGIASNRSRAWRRHPEVALPDDPPVDDPVAAESRHVARDTLSRLAACLRRAGARVWLYYKLRFVEGLTPAEIVRVTGWSRKATYKLKLSLNGAVERCAERLGLL